MANNRALQKEITMIKEGLVEKEKKMEERVQRKRRVDRQSILNKTAVAMFQAIEVYKDKKMSDGNRPLRLFAVNDMEELMSEA